MIDQRLNLFATEVEEARQIAKAPKMFGRRASPHKSGQGEICILRRWNSHTPALLDVLGGGYFMRWNNRGVIVDPGCSYLRLFQGLTSYGLGDVDMMIATHDHIDHCQDFGTILSLLRQFNKWGLDTKLAGFPRTLDVLMSHGVAAQYASFLAHPENVPFLRSRKILPPIRIDRVQPQPKLAVDGSVMADLKVWPPHLRELCTFYNQTVEENYAFQLTALQVKHRELLGDNTSMGLRFDLLNGSPACSVVLSIDTGVDVESSGPTMDLSEPITARRLAQSYAGADLLVLHAGSVEKLNAKGELKREVQHMGLLGVVDILEAMARDIGGKSPKLPKVVVLTEWGYEFGRLGLRGRTQFTRFVAEELRMRGCDQYFAAISDEKAHPDGVPIIPADVGLRLRLPDLWIWCNDSNWVEPKRVRTEERCPEIMYCAS